MQKKALVIVIAFVLTLALASCRAATSPTPTPESPASTSESSSTPQSQAKNTEGVSMIADSQTTNDLGAMSPEDALAYMKEAENLVIVDVAATRWYEEEHFEGAMNIPIEELDSESEDALYMEIPEGRPVLLHCRRGMIVPGAYRRVKELRSDIPEIAYIDGAPLFEEYNDWLAAQ